MLYVALTNHKFRLWPQVQPAAPRPAARASTRPSANPDRLPRQRHHVPHPAGRGRARLRARGQGATRVARYPYQCPSTRVWRGAWTTSGGSPSVCQDEAVRVLAKKLQRSVPDVESRIKVLELAERYGL